MSNRRRAPGAAKGNATLYARIDPVAAAVVDDVARRVGLSKAEFVEALALHLGDNLDRRGVPTWWTRPLPDSQEELRLDAS